MLAAWSTAWCLVFSKANIPNTQQPVLCCALVLSQTLCKVLYRINLLDGHNNHIIEGAFIHALNKCFWGSGNGPVCVWVLGKEDQRIPLELMTFDLTFQV